jgi:hypothetical protein
VSQRIVCNQHLRDNLHPQPAAVPYHQLSREAAAHFAPDGQAIAIGNVPVMNLPRSGHTAVVGSRCVQIEAGGDLSMKLLATMAALTVAACLTGTATAQMPLPFGGTPVPEPGKSPQCTKDYVKSVEAQIAAMEKLRSSGPDFVGQICNLIRSGRCRRRRALDETSTQSVLGVDIDLRFIKTQCRVARDARP